MAVIDELVIMLGLKADGQAGAEVNKISAGLQKISTFATVAGAALTAIGAAVTYAVNEYSQQAAELDKVSRSTAESTDVIQKMGFAMEQSGGSAQSLISDLESLNKSIASPMPGEFNQGLFMLGVSTRNASGELKKGSDILLELSDRFKSMDASKALAWAEKAGISSDTVLMLRQGKDAIQAYMEQAQAFTVPQQAIEAAAKFSRQAQMIGKIINYLGMTVAGSLAPVFEKMTTRFSDWILASKELIQLQLKNIIEGIAGGFRMFFEIIDRIREKLFQFIPGLKDFNKALLEADNVSHIVLITLGLFGAVIGVIAAKFILLAAVIGAAVIVVEDLITYFRGGESVTGRLIEKVQDLANEFKEAFPAIASLAEIVFEWLGKLASWTGGELLKGLSQFWQYLKEIGAEVVALGKIFMAVFEQISKILLGIPKMVTGIAGQVSSMLSSILPDGFLKTIGLDFSGESDPQDRKLITESTHEMRMAQVQPSVINNQTNAPKNINFSNVQNINSNGNSLEVANESARMIRGLDMYPGEYAPVTQ